MMRTEMAPYASPQPSSMACIRIYRNMAFCKVHKLISRDGSHEMTFGAICRVDGSAGRFTRVDWNMTPCKLLVTTAMRTKGGNSSTETPPTCRLTL